MNTIISIVAGLLFFSACASSQSSSGKKKTEMTYQEAAQVLKDFKVANGLKPASPPVPPTSIVEVLEILKADQVSRFEVAREFAAGKQGLEVLYIRGLLELFWGGIQEGTAQMLEEFSAQKAAEVKQFENREASGSPLSDADVMEMERLNKRRAELENAAMALRVLAQTHVTSGQDLAAEIIRQFPKDSKGYIVKAYGHRLRAEWKMFEGAMAKAETLGDASEPNVKYLRAHEKIGRFQLKAEGNAAFSALLQEVPDWVRLQAVLVLTQDNITATHGELEKLRALNPDHVVVYLLGPSIDAEFQAAQALGSE